MSPAAASPRWSSWSRPGGLDGRSLRSLPDRALIRPDVETAHVLHARSPGRAQLIGAIYTRPSDFVAATVAAHFAPVADAFRPHLEAALPHLRFDEVAWRVRWCVLGPVGALLADGTDGIPDVEQPPEHLVHRLVAPLAAALGA